MYTTQRVVSPYLYPYSFCSLPLGPQASSQTSWLSWPSLLLVSLIHLDSILPWFYPAP